MRRGETWVLRQCYRGEARFRLRTTVEGHKPHSQWSDTRVYSLANMPELTQADTDMLIYFAMSVFWRAGIHDWRYEGRHIGVDLGPYLEPIRLFLLDQAPFPDRMILTVRLFSLVKMGEFANAPEGKNDKGFHYHSLTIPGLAFFLVGGRLKEEWFDLSSAPAAGRYVHISAQSDIDALITMAAFKRRQDFW